MSSLETIGDIEAELSEAREATARFLQELHSQHSHELPAHLVPRARELSASFYQPLVRLSSLVSQSQMFGNSDVEAMRLTIRRVGAALRLRRFQEWGPQILNDEDRVLGVSPGGFSEDERLSPYQALDEIDDALDQASRRVGVLRAETGAVTTDDVLPSGGARATASIGIRPGTAFIMMMIDPEKPELEDIKQAIKEECARFGIRATRADEIEHSGEITQKILDEIRTSEFLIADLTGERPSVY
jgi:hypothetical protein